MTVLNDETVELQRVPSRRKMRLHDMSGADMCFMVCVGTILLTTYALGLQFNFLVLVGIAVALFIRYSMGRGYYLISLIPKELSIAVRKGVLWKARADGAKKKLRRGSAAVKLWVTGVATTDGTLGMISNPESKTDNFIMLGDGSDQAALEVSAQVQFNNDLAQTNKSISSEVPFPIGISYLFRRRPMDMYPHRRFGLENYAHGVNFPEGGPPDPSSDRTGAAQAVVPYDRNIVNRRLHANLQEAYATTQMVAADVDRAAIISVKRHAKWRTGLKKGSITLKDIDNAPVARMARRLRMDLTSLGIKNARALSLTETNRFMHKAWDITHAESYYLRCASGEVPTTDEEIMKDAKSGRILSDMKAFPEQHVVAKWDHCVTDGTFHRTIMVVRTPEMALPHLFRQMYSTDARWSSFALCSETMSTLRESINLTVSISLVRAWDSSRSRTYDTPAEIQRRQEMERAHKEQHRSGSVLQLYNVFVAVSATSLEDLDVSTERMMVSLRRAGIKGRVIKGRVFQIPALFSATTGVNLL